MHAEASDSQVEELLQHYKDTFDSFCHIGSWMDLEIQIYSLFSLPRGFRLWVSPLWPCSVKECFVSSPDSNWEFFKPPGNRNFGFLISELESVGVADS